MPRYVKPVLNYNANDVWAAACAAQRINGSYIKFVIEGDTATIINRDITKMILSGSDLFAVTEGDREEGEKVRSYYKGLTFKILQGIKLNEFDTAAMTIANRDTITDMYDVAVITSLPSCYSRATARDEQNRRINFATGGFIGRIGEKVTTSIEVARCIYSHNWNTYYVTGITDNDEAVFFSYRQPMNVGDKVKVVGTVKAHKDNSTQFTRVKLV